jgi:signal peptidase II
VKVRTTVAVAAAIVAVDQAVKALVRSRVPQGSVQQAVPGIDLVHTENSGVSFGLLSGAPPWVVGLTSAVALVLVVGLLMRVAPGRTGRIAAALIIGGAVGNLVDRIARGAVTDFLDLPLLPPCNVADIAITVGALTMAIAIAFSHDDPNTTPAYGRQDPA